MILTCPSCTTRYTVDEAKFPPAGRTVRSAKCGHSWQQSAPEPEPQPAPEPESAPTAEPAGFAAGPATRAYAPTAQVTPEKPRGQGLQTAAVVAGWAGLIAVVLLIGYSAVRYRQDIAAIWPQSAAIYSGVGLKVNAGGIDFRDVAYKRESEDGQPVLVVTGRIVNLASRALPIPQTVRVTLNDADNRELYHWSFKPTAPTLKAGETLAFRTRLSSPPAAARFAIVTFAKDGP
jgi:predicted Zn finger-like uncharacterized protein